MHPHLVLDDMRGRQQARLFCGRGNELQAQRQALSGCQRNWHANCRHACMQENRIRHAFLANTPASSLHRQATTNPPCTDTLCMLKTWSKRRPTPCLERMHMRLRDANEGRGRACEGGWHAERVCSQQLLVAPLRGVANCGRCAGRGWQQQEVHLQACTAALGQRLTRLKMSNKLQAWHLR